MMFTTVVGGIFLSTNVGGLLMTVQEMYDEMVEQSIEDRYYEIQDYDDHCDIIEVEYTTQN